MIAGVMLAGGCSTSGGTSVRAHPELAAALARVETIAILPVEVGQLRKTAFSGDELQLARERAIGRELTRTLRGALRSRSYSVVSEPELWPGDEIRPETPEAVELRSAWASLESSPAAAMAPGDARALRMNVGPVAQSVAMQYQADALLIVHSAGYEKSGGRKAADVVSSALIAGVTGLSLGPIAESEGEIRLALIARSGEVLWTNRISGPTDRKRGAVAARGYQGPADLAAHAVAPFPARTPGP